MSPAHDETAIAADLAQELFADLGRISVRRMFGGAGIYSGGVIFALIFEGEIYLKTSADTVADFEQAGCRQFVWVSPKQGKTLKMDYWTLPDFALDDAEAACEWARRSLEISRQKALLAKKKKPKK